MERKRKRITKRIGSSDGFRFELTAQGVLDQAKVKERRKKELSHMELRAKAAETVAINALDYLLNNGRVFSPQTV
jgi:hypothetical protein